MGQRAPYTEEAAMGTGRIWHEVDYWREDMARPSDPGLGYQGAEWWDQPIQAEPSEPRSRPVSFRVVDTRGQCLNGIRAGDVISVTGSGREVSPHLCPYAESVLRVAAVEDEVAGINEWCCPVYDHLLVFRREVRLG